MINNKSAKPLKALRKSINWIKNLGKSDKDDLSLVERISYVTILTYKSVRNIYKVRKDIVKSLVDETSLSKKQAKKIVDDSVLSVPDAFDADEDRVEAYGYLETYLIMIYSIRGNMNYAKEVHRYCDNDLKTLNWMVNEDGDNQGWLTIAYQKSLNVMIDKYMDGFDKFGIVSKKYDGIIAQGHAKAQYNLGNLYANGDGVLKDLSKAKYWINKAYENPNAETRIVELAEKGWNQLELWKY